MTPPDNAHRAEFTVRCACGIEYHTSDDHAGRMVTCKCGRTVPLIRPVSSPADEEATVRRRKKKVRRTGGAAYNHSYSASSAEAARAAKLNWQRRPWNPLSLVDFFVRPIRRGSWPTRLSALAAWAYLGGTCIAWALLAFTSDKLLVGTVLAYGPRWLALFPLFALVPVALIFSRSALVPLALGALVVAHPIMGARLSLFTIASRKLPTTPPAGLFRVITFNTQGGRPLARDLGAFVGTYKPDVLMFQECGDALWESLQKQQGWQSARHGTLCTASHWPMGDVETMSRDEFITPGSENFGGTGLVMRANFGSPNGPLAIVNLHLETARHGLEGLISNGGIIPDGPDETRESRAAREQAFDEQEQRFENNAIIRERESQLASQWAVQAAGSAPLIIAGDFNLPVESTIFNRYWSRFNDAFEKRGNGLGWTKFEGRWLRIRIDHLLTTDDGPKPQRVVVGSGFLSDHLPVIADYAWPKH